MSEKNDCEKISGAFDENTLLDDQITIESLLQKPFEKHIGTFEIPNSLKMIFSCDEINAIITWYLNWKLVENINMQNTCTIQYIFGQTEGIKVIIAINLYKYLRNKDYDPNIIEKIKMNNQIFTD